MKNITFERVESGEVEVWGFGVGWKDRVIFENKEEFMEFMGRDFEEGGEGIWEDEDGDDVIIDKAVATIDSVIGAFTK
tara:strand:+ start:15700 stop:15933 length:234 start_codon:yes stop_codon:yes gene_type:complete